MPGEAFSAGTVPGCARFNPGVDRIGFFRYNKTKLETVCFIPAMKEGPLRAFHGNRFTEAPLESGAGRI